MGARASFQFGLVLEVRIGIRVTLRVRVRVKSRDGPGMADVAKEIQLGTDMEGSWACQVESEGQDQVPFLSTLSLVTLGLGLSRRRCIWFFSDHVCCSCVCTPNPNPNPN